LADYEKKWLKIWNERHLFESDPVKGKKKVFVTFPYPYMNGPVHVGHCFTSTRVDVYARFKRMQGNNVLFPWAWHWTGESIAGMSYRLKQGDEEVRRGFEIDGVPPKEVEKFTDPEYLASYYTKVSRRVVQETGLSIDWRREFTTIDPAYKKFIDWQYRRLRDLGYVVQGTHPVVWCSLDQSPTGDHDRLEGEGVSPEEFTLVKFRVGDFFLVAGTLRPETIFGATNIWVNPEVEYSEARVDGELWIVSSSALRRLAEQKRSVTPLRSFKGNDLIGKNATAPLTKASLPILPARFVDPDLATGVVYSVPAHAPYDYMGLKDIQTGRSPASRQVTEIAARITPISIIRIPDHSEYPAEDAVKKLGISDAADPKLEDATSKVYKEEFHKGVMQRSAGRLAGLKVSDAKGKVLELIEGEGLLATMQELPQRVVCRCGTRCYVKILENQWFLNYSNEGWKAKTKELIAKAAVFPQESREWYNATIDWLRDWPCARRSGMGTKLPWDKDWIVETLSDSTIYMAFYTINKFVNSEKVRPENLSPEVLDYVILGRGSSANLAKAARMPEKLLREMRDEFLYWYPVDLRNSAKELIPNHLTFFAFHHVAIFDERFWPRGFSVNGMIQIEGRKLSKSHGFFVPWKDAVERYGADAVRATVILTGDGMEDTDWRAKNAEDAHAKIDSLIAFVEKSMSGSVERPPEQLDRWLISTVRGRITEVTSALEELRTRRAIAAALLDLWNNVRWYLHRTEKPRRKTLTEVFSAWARLLSPFTPFVAEELNRALGGKGLVCTADWPSPEDFPRDEGAELSEVMLARVLEDARNLLKIVKQPKHKLNIYVASEEARRFFVEVVTARAKKEGLGNVIKKFPNIGIPPERVIKLQYEAGDELVSRIMSQPNLDEFQVLRSASGFISRELGIEVEVVRAGAKGIRDPGKRASDALPLKPAFYLE